MDANISNAKKKKKGFMQQKRTAAETVCIGIGGKDAARRSIYFADGLYEDRGG